MGRLKQESEPGDLPENRLVNYTFGKKGYKMNVKNYFAALAFLLSTLSSYSQENISYELDELIIEHQKISNQSKSQRTIIFNDSIINQSVGTFTDFLQKNTNIYFKEEGYGMVSSPSFRGTTSQQTSVLWNGIKINSPFLGQSDFNSTAFKNYDNIIVKPGGGSVLYGSGAVGGTIHLNNELQFDQKFTNQVQVNYGSFNTQGIHYKVLGGTKKWAVQAYFGYNHSDNDYEWLGKNQKNINGQFENVDLGVGISYKLNDKNTLAFHSSSYNDDRHFSLLTPYQTKTKYKNSFYRNLLKWHYKTNRFLNTFYIANFQEKYSYFDQLPSDRHSGGNASMWFIKNEMNFQATKNWKLSALLEYQKNTGEGIESGLPLAQQEIASLALLSSYDLNKNSGFEIGLKNEFAKDYQNPFLFSAGYFWNNSFYELKINTSKNYRIPTFNDLYWQPGGNLDLKPEKSYQIDLNNDFKFRDFTFNLSVYYSSISEMIRWIPTTTGYWEAQNTNKVTVFGTEISLNYQKKWNNQVFSSSINHAYTKSINESNNKQLTYTPLHKLTGQISYQYKTFSITPSFQYVGKIYTTESNDEQSTVDAYGLFDIDFQHFFNSKKFPFTLNFKIKNIANTAYTILPERQMPGRNYHIQFIKKF